VSGWQTRDPAQVGITSAGGNVTSINFVDADGQVWTVTVGTDGQLQVAGAVADPGTITQQVGPLSQALSGTFVAANGIVQVLPAVTTAGSGTVTAPTFAGSIVQTLPSIEQEAASSLDYSDEVLADSPFAYWRFEETTGTTATDENATYAATLNGSPDLDVAGKVGSGIDYPTTGAYTSHTTLGTFGQELRAHTVEFWVKTTRSPSADEFFFGTFNTGTTALGLQMHTNGQILIRSQSGGATDRVNVIADLSGVNDGEWHHIVLAVDDATRVSAPLRVRVDGSAAGLTFVDSGRALDGWANFDFPITFGARNVRGTVGGGTVCLMDEVALYDYALSDARIGVHFSAA